MSDSITYDDVVNMLDAAAEEVKANQETLSKLDSFGGDGDHGTTMARAMGQVEKAAGETPSREIKSLLHNVGWAVMGVDGGATGPLLGTLFMSMSEAAGDKDVLDAAVAAAMFESGLAGVRRRTKAQPGDKTLLDALVPAVEALRRAAQEGASTMSMFDRASQAAVRGAAATRGMQARYGRAKNLGERSIGAQDPGATSISLLFRGFARGLEGRGETV